MTLIYCFSISAHLCIHSVEKVQIGIKGHCQGQGVIESQSQAIKSKLEDCASGRVFFFLSWMKHRL